MLLSVVVEPSQTRKAGFAGKYAAAEPIEKSHFEDPRPDADLKMSLMSVISMIRRFY